MIDPVWTHRYPPGIDWNADITPQPVTHLLDQAAERYGSNRAIDFMGKHTSYSQLRDKALRLATGLRKLGVRRGVKVGLALPNCPQFVIAYYGILYAGGTVVNFNPLYAAKEMIHQINDSGTEVMITLALNATYPGVAACLDKSDLKHVISSSLAAELPLAKRLAFPLLRKGEIAEIPKDDRHHDWADLLESEPLSGGPTIHPDSDIAVIQYTGGTTGVPKGVVLTHGNVHVNAVQSGMWFNECELGKEKMLGVLPLFHVFAMTVVMNFSILKGAEMILHPRFVLKDVLGDIDKKGPTLMPGVSAMYSAINSYPKLKKYDLKSIKYCISGGGPLPVEVKKQFEQLTGCTLVEGYGLSESSPVASCNPLVGENKEGSIGLPLPGTTIEVYDKDDREKKLPAGETGEIVIRGPQVMRSYHEHFNETQEILRQDAAGRRLHTGDVGYMDSDGYFYIVDRLKEMIISGGYNIYPRQIEEALYKHPNITDAAVIGVPHDKRGEVPKAFIVLQAGTQLDKAGLRSYLKDEIPPYAVPHDFEFIAELPKTMIGKVDKKQLKANL